MGWHKGNNLHKRALFFLTWLQNVFNSSRFYDIIVHQHQHYFDYRDATQSHIAVYVSCWTWINGTYFHRTIILDIHHNSSDVFTHRITEYKHSMGNYAVRSRSAFVSCPQHTLHWRHNEHDGVSNHQPNDCLLNRLFRQIKENIKAPCHWSLCGEFTGDRWIPRTKGQ